MKLHFNYFGAKKMQKVTVKDGKWKGFSAIGKTEEKAKENLKKKIIKHNMKLTPVEMALLSFAFNWASEYSDGRNILDIDGFDSEDVMDIANSIWIKLDFAKITTKDEFFFGTNTELFKEYVKNKGNE